MSMPSNDDPGSLIAKGVVMGIVHVLTGMWDNDGRVWGFYCVFWC